MAQDNKSQILKWQFEHQWGKNIFQSTGPALWAVSVLLWLYLSMLMVGLGIYWVTTDLPIFAEFYGSPIWVAGHELLPNKPESMTCNPSGDTEEKIKRHLNVFGVVCDIKPVFREGRFNSLLNISLQCSRISWLLFGLTNLQPTSNSRDFRERSYG